ncbi:heterokaryon incompatibility, partial [Setomelanomma holmii]
MKCSLETYNYNTCPDYWALSYTWGPETPSHVILVNGRRFCVRQNLFNFMKSFRSPYNNHFYLWIDQVCINQEDIPERNSQVRCMGQYYSRAVCVLTWLGIGTELELAAMARIQQVDIVNVPPAKYQEPNSLDHLRGYRSIIANHYFERLWVVQEMARA